MYLVVTDLSQHLAHTVPRCFTYCIPEAMSNKGTTISTHMHASPYLLHASLSYVVCAIIST